jgi:trigger factor
LSSTDTVENNPTPETSEATHEQDIAHEGHDHEHEGHDHEHQHGPVLNPDCTRELALDVDAAEVSKA